MRLRLDISYDGTDFSGWGTQPELRTVQGTLERALMTLLRLDDPARLVVAGRTDAGVHASGQVAHVDVEGVGDLDRFHKRLSSILKRDPDVSIRRISEAPEGFDARFSPMARRYEYRLIDDPRLLNPLDRRFVVAHPQALDIVALNSAAEMLVGLRDFASFCKPRVGATTIRELQEFTWERLPNHTLIARLKADAFCHSMVRSLIGACVAVGAGKLPIDSGVLAHVETKAPRGHWINAPTLEHLRDARERTAYIKVMPPHGLNLVEVLYPPDEGLAARAELTRARRDLAGAQPME